MESRINAAQKTCEHQSDIVQCFQDFPHLNGLYTSPWIFHGSATEMDLTVNKQCERIDLHGFNDYQRAGEILR